MAPPVIRDSRVALAGHRLAARSVAECVSAEVADAMTRCFEGYLVPVEVTPRSYEARMRSEDLDPFASKLYFLAGEVVGVVLVARRGWTSRIAAMGVAPKLRGQGLGRAALEAALGAARGRGDRRVLLEVFERNETARRLYESAGFRAVRRLVGYRWIPPAAASPAEALEEIDPLRLARLVVRHGDTDLPWMLSAETLAAATRPAIALALEDRAFALVVPLDDGSVGVRCLLVKRSHRRIGWGSRMIASLAARYPGSTLLIPQVVPEGLARGFFSANGWVPEALTQLEMEAIL